MGLCPQNRCYQIWFSVSVNITAIGSVVVSRNSPLLQLKAIWCVLPSVYLVLSVQPNCISCCLTVLYQRPLFISLLVTNIEIFHGQFDLNIESGIFFFKVILNVAVVTAQDVTAPRYQSLMAIEDEGSPTNTYMQVKVHLSQRWQKLFFLHTCI